MPLWGKTDAAASAPKFVAVAANGAIANALFGTSVFGVDATEAALAGKGITPGWVLVRKGTGPVTSVTIGAAGSGYANGASLTFTPTNGGSGAAATITTNGTGGITAITFTSGGSGYITAPTVSAPTGTAASLTAVLGGHAGRVFRENLVATRITTDAEDVEFPDA